MRRWGPAWRAAALCAAVGVWLALSRRPGPGDSTALTAAQNAAVPQSRTAPPIILISIDTLRADHLSCYGYKGLATTHIDRMASGGTVFLEASAQVPLTLPSHVSLLTSTYPFSSHVEDNGERLPSNAVTLAGVLKAQGYRTAAFVGAFVLDRRFGLDQGFDVYEGPSNPLPGKDPGDTKRFGEDVVRAATGWLERNAGHPFFLFVHLYDLHTPYTFPPAERRRGAGYDAELAYVDHVLGKFWDFLAQRGVLERSLVIFTADHGESLREHGESTHGYFVYQSTLRVPLILHWPKQSPRFATRVSEPVSLLDVAPTVAEFARIARPAAFQGLSLLRLASPPVPATARSNAPEEIYGESLYAHAHFGTSTLRTLRIGAYKYIQAPRPEFYDLLRDPDEKRNLYEARKSVAVGFRERLQKLLTRYPARGVSVSPPPRPDTIEKLRSLGYLSGGAEPTAGSDGGVDPKDRIIQYEKYGRAISLAGSGQLRASNVALERLLDEDPNLADVRATLGLNLQKLGRHAEAAKIFKTILQQNPRSAVAHFNLAVSEHALGEGDETEKQLRAALDLAPYYVRAEEMLAVLYLERKDYERARRHLNHVMTIDPASYAANYNLGALDTLQGRWEEGARCLRAAIQADPASAEAHNTLGSLHLRRNDIEAAAAEFGEAIRLNPQFAAAHYNLGMVFHRQQKAQEAAREFQKALSADPNFRAAREALDRLPSAGATAEPR